MRILQSLPVATGLLGAFVLTAAPLRADEPTAGHFRFSGPMERLVAKGVAVAPVTSGLAFTILISDNGATATPTRLSLKGNGWNGPISLFLENPKFLNGHFTAQAKLENTTGTAIEGLRLDITGASEEYQAKDEPGDALKDATGKEVIRTRGQAASIPSPLFFGDLAKGDASEALVLDVQTATFSPDTRRISVHGLVSGLRFVNDFSVGALTDYEIDTDAQGRLYVAGGDKVVRTDGDGSHLTEIITADPDNADETKGIPDCHGVAVNRATGAIFVNGGNNRIVAYSPTGQEISRLFADKDKNGIDWLTLGVRVDSKGRLYNCGDNNRVIQCIANGKQVWAATVENAVLFDIDAQQNTYACTDQAVWQIDAAGKIINRKLINGPDWHPGHIYNPQSVRLDNMDNIYVLEREKGPEEEGGSEVRSLEAARASVFTKDGRFLRVWGRGGKASPLEQVWPGQIYNPVDLAFGPNGTVYVLCPRMGAETRVLAFQPF